MQKSVRKNKLELIQRHCVNICLGFEGNQVSGQGSRYVAWQDIFKIPRELAGMYVYWFKY
jgi:hypothetical protein